MNLPDEMDADLLDILGMPNFRCGPIAHAMQADGVAIPTKAGAEQAHVLFKLLGFYAEHGSKWREAAGDWLVEMRNRVAAKST
jgi:hypothetical protein